MSQGALEKELYATKGVMQSVLAEKEQTEDTLMQATKELMRDLCRLGLRSIRHMRRLLRLLLCIASCCARLRLALLSGEGGGRDPEATV